MRWCYLGRVDYGEALALQLELREAVPILGIVLDCSHSGLDYARGYKIFVSSDGKSWGKPIAKGKGTAVTKVTFAKPVAQRFIKIVQTARAKYLWSLDEIRLTPAKE